MPVAIIDVMYVKRRIDKEATSEMLYYDAVDKAMRKFSGGMLIYEYIEFEFNGELLQVNVPGIGWVNGKTVPNCKDVKVVAYKDGDNYQDIVKWYDENKEELSLEALNLEISAVGVQFPLAKQADIEDALQDMRFRYTIHA